MNERLGRGLGTSQIAGEFGTSMKTIQSHRARIKEKLNAAGATTLRFPIPDSLLQGPKNA